MKIECIEDIYPFNKGNFYEWKFEGEYVSVEGFLLTKKQVNKYFKL